MKGISDQDYDHAQQVWNRITSEYENITLGDYYNVYIATGILLLADMLKTQQVRSGTRHSMSGLIKDSR